MSPTAVDTEERVAPSGSRAFDRMALALAALAVCAAYVPLVDNAFVMDDVYLVAGADGLGDPGALGGMLLRPFWQNSSYLTELLHDYWRPATTFALWLTAFVAGKVPFAFHALSLLGLAAATISFAALLRRFAPPGGRSVAVWLAVIFAAHPLAAEIAGMAANVSDHLALAFMAAQILVLDGHKERGGAWRLVAVGLLGGLACGSKEIGLVSAIAPAVALSLARASGRAVTRRDWLTPSRWVTAAAPVALYLALRAYVTSRAGWAATAWPSPDVLALSLGMGPGLALQSIVAPIPSGANVHASARAVWPWVLAVVAWAGIAVAVARPLRRRRPLGLSTIGVALALAWLVPSLLGVGRLDDGALRFPMRYFHLPLAGLLIAVLPTAARLWRRALRFAMPAAAVLLVVLSWLRVEEWQDEISFFTAEAAYHPESMPDQINAISAFTHSHAFAAAEEAIARVDKQPESSAPRFRSRILNERAAILVLRDGNMDAAARLLREAIAVSPDDLGNVLDLASVRMTAGRSDQAVAILDEALASPRFRDYRRAAIEARRRKYLGALGGTPATPGP